MWKPKNIQGRHPFKNTLRIIDDEKHRAEFARKTGASISRRAINEFYVPSANEWKKAKLRSASSRP